MTTARDVRLVRVPGLRGAHQAIARMAGRGDSAGSSTTIILVPTRQSSRELRLTLARLARAGGDIAASAARATDVAILTRDDLHTELHRRLALPLRLVTRATREALAARASDATIAAGLHPPFTVRPGLIAETLALYDAVRRHGRSAGDFERVLTFALEPGAESDRGAARLLQQTRFLADLFRRYEQALADAGALDEHGVRALAELREPVPAVRQLIVTIADQAAEAGGLWPADFDLLTRLPGLAFIDVVATTRVLDAGLRERLFDRLPGIVEEAEPESGSHPVLLVPVAPASPSYHSSRDRLEELALVARHVIAEGRGTSPHRLDDVLVVYDRPLPYVYLAQRVFEDCGLRFTTSDALPLAAEPAAAVVDLVLDAVASGLSPASLMGLVESPLLSWRPGGRRLTPRDLALLRAFLREHSFAGGRASLERLGSELPRTGLKRRARARLRRGMRAALLLADDLRALDGARSTGDELRALADLLRRRAAPVVALDHRLARARDATLQVLDELADAHTPLDDRPATLGDLRLLVRTAIEHRTFALRQPAAGDPAEPLADEAGIRLADASAARYADAALVWLVGVIEGEWPRSAPRSIFYPAGLLRDLGFPSDHDRQLFARAAFRDLVMLARSATALSTFQLEEDAIVRPSSLLEDLDDLAIARAPLPLTPDPIDVQTQHEEWAAWRRELTRGEPRFHGAAGPPPPRVLSVTQIDRYLECPFRFFSSVLLGLEEERERDEIGLDPRRRGTLVHAVFQSFFRRWADAGHGAITSALLAAARLTFAEVVEHALVPLGPADRVLERTRLVGSSGAVGLGERVFRLEAERAQPVVERLLEFDLRGTYDFSTPAGAALDRAMAGGVAGDPLARVALRGFADRIDLLADGTLRLVDYKTGHAPDARRSIQLAVYALCAEQKLDGYRGRRWRVSTAAYLALGDARPWSTVVSGADDREALEAARTHLAEALGGIARGDFPPAPAERRLCATCAYAAVCRKEYVDSVA